MTETAAFMHNSAESRLTPPSLSAHSFRADNQRYRNWQLKPVRKGKKCLKQRFLLQLLSP